MADSLKLYQKLLTIQKKINGLGKDKSTYNYKYVTGDKVLGIIKPLMNELGLLLKQEILSIENTRQDYTLEGKDGNKKNKSEILSKVDMRFTWIDCATGEKDANLFGANGQNDWEKGLGSALTYAERYFLLKFFHIATDEDDIDNDERKDDERKPAKSKTNSDNKSIMPPKTFQRALEQISAGEPGIIERVQSSMIVTPEQLKALQEAENEVKQSQNQ